MTTMMVYRNSNRYFYRYCPWVKDDDDILYSMDEMENERVLHEQRVVEHRVILDIYHRFRLY